MRIDANSRTIKKLLINEKFEIDYYQREYSWQTDHVSELIDDLASNFSESYKEEHERNIVSSYKHYFLGSIIICDSDGKKYIVDGQQRFTTITLILIKLYHLLEDENEKKQLGPLIYSQSGAKKGFNLYVNEWEHLLSHLYPNDKRENITFDIDDQPESIQNIFLRYNDIEDCLEFSGKKLLYFVDWLLNNVYLVEIVAFDSKDAYAIFESVNDRGLELTPSDMLRGYLLSSIDDTERRDKATQLWSECTEKLKHIGKNEESEAMKAWLRSKYAQNLNDFDEIGSEFHRWVGKNEFALGLDSSDAFADFIERDFQFYLNWYCRLRKAANSFAVASEDGLQYVYYNAQHNKFTLQYPFLLAILDQSNSENENLQKIKIVAEYLDILIYRRIWNSDSIAQNTMANIIPTILTTIRGKNTSEIVDILYNWVEKTSKPFTNNKYFRLQSGNRRKLFLILARMSDYVGVQSEDSSHYQDYMRTGKNCYEIEHIWSKDYTSHSDEFDEYEFNEYRDRIGGLLILSKSENASIGDDPYSKKRNVYSRANKLAQSLHEKTYRNNPGFHRFIERSGLKFEPYQEFKKEQLDYRQKLYTQLAEQIWNPDRLHKEYGNELGLIENGSVRKVDQDVDEGGLKENEPDDFFGKKSMQSIDSIIDEIMKFYRSKSESTIRGLKKGITELHAIITTNGWDQVSLEFKKLYCAFYIGKNPVFGMYLFQNPRFVVWMDTEEANKIDESFIFRYEESRRQAIFHESTQIEELLPILESIYYKML